MEDKPAPLLLRIVPRQVLWEWRSVRERDDDLVLGRPTGQLQIVGVVGLKGAEGVEKGEAQRACTVHDEIMTFAE